MGILEKIQKRSIILVNALVLTACQNQLTAPLSEDNNSAPTELNGKFQGFVCNPGVESSEYTAIRKLTRSEISSRLEAMVKNTHRNTSYAQQMWNRLVNTNQILSLIPDERSGQYDRMTPALAYGSSTIEGIYSITGEIARALSLGTTESNNWRDSFVGASCASVANPSEACMRTLATRLFSSIAPGQSNVDLINAAVTAMLSNLPEDTGSPKQGWIQIGIVSVLMSAQGLYRTETGLSANQGWRPLNDFELVTRLASVFWMSAPDSQLLTWAISGQVRENYDEVLNHLFSDAKFETTMIRFAEQYLRLDDTRIVDFNSSPAVQDRVAAYGLSGLNLSTQYSDEAKEEARRFFVELLKRNESLKEIFLSDASFAQGTLAAAQNVPAWVSGQAPQKYSSGKHGLFTLTAIHLGNGTSKNHIHTAYTIFKNLLCQSTPSPESAGVNPQELVIPPPQGIQTSRERTERLVSPSQCASCHVQFDYLGFGFGRMDPWGIDRASERIYDPVSFAYLGDKPIVTSVSFNLGSQSRSKSNSKELAEELVASEYPQACFARQFYRFAFGEEEIEGGEMGCALQSFLDSLKRDDVSLKDALKAFARSRVFTERYVGGSP